MNNYFGHAFGLNFIKLNDWAICNKCHMKLYFYISLDDSLMKCFISYDYINLEKTDLTCEELIIKNIIE